jgi:lysine 6-dehydrogenase
LPQTFLGKIRDLDYKTIRYPGHCAKFKTLVDLGLASSDPVNVGGASIAPRRLLGRLLVDNLPHDEPDVVLVRIEFRGENDGKSSVLRYEIIDEQDQSSGLSAMMRTTAFPASIVAQMMARGETFSRGALPQERCIPPDAFVAELAKRNIVIEES